MKILFYSHFYPPEVGAAPTRIKYFVDALCKKGSDVKIIAPKPNYPLGKIFDGFNKKLIVKNEIENVTYLPIYSVSSHSPIGRLFSYLSYFLTSFFYLLFNSYKPDVVISSSPPIFTSLAALFYSKIKRSKFIFDVRDIWPDIGIQLGILNNRFFIYGLTKIEKYLLNNADKIIVTAKGDKDNISAKINNAEKCEIIFNGADTEIFKPINETEKIDVRKNYHLPLNKKILIYFGSYNYGMNDIDVLGEFLIHEKVISNNIHFLSIGSGDNLNNLLKKIDNKILFTSIKSLEMNELAKLLAASDISIIPRKNIKEDTGGNIPVKCFESWAAGIPVLLSNIEDAEIAEIFDKCNAGALVKTNDVDALIDGLNEILNKDLEILKKEGREFVIENFDRKKQSLKLAELLM